GGAVDPGGLRGRALARAEGQCRAAVAGCQRVGDDPHAVFLAAGDHGADAVDESHAGNARRFLRKPVGRQVGHELAEGFCQGHGRLLQFFHLPLNTGFRRSLNASTPSRRSLVSTSRLYASISNIRPRLRSICKPWWIALRAWRTDSGALSQIVRAVSVTASINVPGSHTRFSTPHSSACAAVNCLPVRMISFARRSPTMRGSVCVPPPPGMMPIVTSVRAKRAVLTA